ncbi:MAG: energy-coupling factor transporter ATPase [Clostridia bacterium]|nr:energy-coupling factor transporter ATPase [Clostridia bacterium]
MTNKNIPFIETKDLSFHYDNEDSADRVLPSGDPIPVFDGLNLTVEKGEYVAVLGHNGSGKSTFAKLLNMILEPTSGQILIDGRDITAEDMSEKDLYDLRKKVGMVFQNPDNQLVATIVEEDVAFGPENLGVPSDEIRRRVDDALAVVGMTEYARHEPHRLSGGQKQRVAIAGLIAMMPECMIFDESTAMLDPIGRREVLNTMRMLNRDYGITILTITHYMNEAAEADRVIVLDDGRILIDGTPEEVFSESELLRSVGLDVPQCVDFAEALKENGLLIEGDCTTPEKCAAAIARALEGLRENRHCEEEGSDDAEH